MTILYKGIVIVIGLVLITLGICWLMQRIQAYQDKFAPPPVKEDFSVWGPIDWVFSIAENIEVLGSLISSITGILTTISIYSIIIASLSNLSKGIFLHVKCGFEWFGIGFANGFQVFWILFGCMLDKIFNTLNGDCIRFYFVDLIYGLIYFIGSAVLSIIWTITGVDLHPVITVMWDVTVVPLDSMIFAFTGMNITRWSEETHKRCYKCSADFGPNGQAMRRYDNLDFYQWAQVLRCSIDEMSEGIYKIFTSVVPSRKWTSWLAGDHQEGWDDDPPFTF